MPLPYKKMSLLLIPVVIVGSAVLVQVVSKSLPRPEQTRLPDKLAEFDPAPEETLGATIAPPIPQPKITPKPALPKASAVASLPAELLNLTNWKLTLPINTAQAGNPDEIKQPALATYSNANYFKLTGDKKGVVFTAPVGGAHTSGSSYPRSELREMAGGGKQNAAWSNKSGVHTMTSRQAITHLPVVKPEVVALQIHDGGDDVMQVRLGGKRLEVWWNDGKNKALLDDNYSLGRAFDVKIEAAGSRFKVWYNGAQKADVALSGSGWYFKAGCYTQSSPSKGDAASAYGEVVIYSLNVSHS